MLIAAVLAGVASIFLSTQYLSRFPYGEVIFPWQFPIWVLVPVFATGFLLCVCVILKPTMFWQVLVGTSILTAGMFVLRFSIFDEWLVAWIALGGVLAAKNGSIRPRSGQIRPGWIFCFLALGFHLFVMSIVGLIAHGNLKAVRFSATFAIVIVIGYLLAKYDFPRPDARRITLMTASLCLAYYVLTILHGVVFKETVFVENIMWGIGFSGAGNLTVAGVVGMPAACILIGRERGWRRVLGWAMMLVGLVIIVLGDSRGGMLSLLGTVLVAPFAVGFKPMLKMAASGILATIVIGTAAFNRPQWGLDMGDALLSAFHIQSGGTTRDYFGRQVMMTKGDAGRFMYVRSAIQTLLENPLLALTGVGTYGYFPAVAPYLAQVADEREVPLAIVNYGSSIGGVVEPPRPPALGGFIAETGLIGVTLILLCCAAAISATVLRRSRARDFILLRGPNLLVAASVAFIMAWMYFGEIQDLMLLYVLIMPYGIAHTWGQMDNRGRSAPMLLRGPVGAAGPYRRPAAYSWR
ncbi:MAG: hypothetical protein AAB225_02655 [Acidobacteriota bacterium]